MQADTANTDGVSSTHYVVVGLGLTGISCIRYLVLNGKSVSVVDSRAEPPGLETLLEEFANINVTVGSLNEDVLRTADYLIVSPGVSLQEPAIAKAIAAGAHILSDVDLFCRSVELANRIGDQRPDAKIAAITGSNGKSTVASLLHAMVIRDGIPSSLCGNIGVPVLDVVDKNSSVFVVELSSFQLERSSELRTSVATVLNVSADHMDRYASLEEYRASKLSIYKNCDAIVFNREDLLTKPVLSHDAKTVSFGFDSPTDNNYGLIEHDGADWIACGDVALIDAAALRLPGRHNLLNAMAALAMGDVLGLARDAMLEELLVFAGLPHRCEWVADINGVAYINDSKGTNTGATQAAINGLAKAKQKSIVLIAGGIGKDADFSELCESVSRAVKVAILFGQDASEIQAALESSTTIELASDLGNAVETAYRYAQAGDTVLFSPACASFDMFKSFEHRGLVYCESVHAQKLAVA